MPLADLPQSNKQHAVPQNIMDVEFKLIGDLTMRQFAYLLVCGVLAYISYALALGLFKVLLVPFFSILGLALAFAPIQERGLDEWIANFFKSINAPTQRVWKKEPQVPTAFSYQSFDVMKQELITLAFTSDRRKLEAYLKYQNQEETVKDPLDIPEMEYLSKVRAAFANEPTHSGVGVALEEEPKVEVAEQVQNEQPQELPQPQETEQENTSEENKEVGKPINQEVQKPEEKIEDMVENSQEPLASFPTEDKPATPTLSQATPQPHLAPVVHQKPKIVEKKQTPLLKDEEIFQTPEIQIMPLTPDMYSGRAFTNLVPSSGELILPIRGERVIRTAEDLQVEEDVKEKADKLKKLLSFIKESEGIKIPVVAPDSVISPNTFVTTPSPNAEEEKVKKEAENAAESLKEKNERLNAQISKMKEEISHSRDKAVETIGQEKTLKGLEEEKEKIASSYTELSKRVQELEQKLEEKRQADVVTGSVKSLNIPSKTQMLTQKPDILSGYVVDIEGKSVPNVILIVRNKKGETVRAVKSNSLGQFILLTPLDKGYYTVEVSLSNNLSSTFDIIPIEVKGEVIPSLEFKGK